MIIAITGCLGFIGREVARQCLMRGYWVYGIDAITYAADETAIANLQELGGRYGNFKFIAADIADLEHLPDIDVVINLAAETHVDNSILDPSRFLHSNVVGVQNLLELVRSKRNYQMPRFIQISTDEVYGDTPIGSASVETDKLDPSSPYSASKASADLLILSYARTFGIKYNIIRPSNCYGPHQYPEKLIPKVVRHLKFDKPIPIHNDGSQVRTWIHVTDAASAILTVLDKGTINEIYNIGGETSSVIDVARQLVTCHPIGRIKPFEEFCQFDYKRAGIDLHYRVNDFKLRTLGWSPSKELANELPVLYNHFIQSKRF